MAAGFLIALSPFILIICVLIKFTSSGPILIKQKRVGRGGKTFLMYKFRSMRINIPSKAHQEFMKHYIKGELTKADRKEGIYKLKDDPRVTPIGRFIRSYSLDEIPQFLNVLKGEMSIVGPRPAIPYELQWYKDWQKKRLDVLPGITGLWQTKGRNKLSFDAGVRYDLKYIRNQSLWLDLKIMFDTVFVMLFRRER